jgi:hypothetical protein
MQDNLDTKTSMDEVQTDYKRIQKIKNPGGDEIFLSRPERP